ncbi:MAG TPA: biotin/lipoyl-containing protein, partial [Mucilaginibacter sp.]
MSLEIKVPPVGESITEVTLSRWLKKDGDTVAMDEVIAELESDKATFELTAEKAGTLKIIANEGDTLAIGAPVASIIEGGTAAPTPVAASAPAVAAVSETTAQPAATVNPAQGASTSEIKVPPVGESITEVTLSRWMKKDGDTVAMDEAIAELESDKATFELTADKAGVLKTIAKEGDTLAIGAPVASITGGGASVSAAPATAPAAVAAATDKTYASGVPSPAAAKILAEKGVDPASVNGSGVAGRITKEDALNAQSTPAKPAATPAAAAPATTAPVKAGERSEKREKTSSLRKVVAKRLVSVKNETAMLTTFNEVDMSPIMELRGKYKDKFKEKHGVGLVFMSFFTKAVTEALKE